MLTNENPSEFVFAGNNYCALFLHHFLGHSFFSDGFQSAGIMSPKPTITFNYFLNAPCDQSPSFLLRKKTLLSWTEFNENYYNCN